MNIHSLALGKTVFFTAYLYVDHIAGNYKGYEDRHAVDLRQGFAFRGNIRYFYIDESLKFLLFRTQAGRQHGHTPCICVSFRLVCLHHVKSHSVFLRNLAILVLAALISYSTGCLTCRLAGCLALAAAALLHALL